MTAAHLKGMKAAFARGGWIAVLCLAAAAAAYSAAYAATDYETQWGPAVGTVLPMLDALDQDGQRRRFDDLAGEHGLLLFFSRSTDW
jgi:hypothetical protein